MAKIIMKMPVAWYHVYDILAIQCVMASARNVMTYQWRNIDQYQLNGQWRNQWRNMAAGMTTVAYIVLMTNGSVMAKTMAKKSNGDCGNWQHGVKISNGKIWWHAA